MEAHGTFVGAILRSTSKAHAAGAVLRMTSTDARAVATFGTSGSAELRDLAEGLVGVDKTINDSLALADGP